MRFFKVGPRTIPTASLDRAYLRSLYAGSWNLPADRRLQRIGAAVERELAGSAAAAR